MLQAEFTNLDPETEAVDELAVEATGRGLLRKLVIYMEGKAGKY